MDQPEPASWPADFPKTRRLDIMASARTEYATLIWDKEQYDGIIEWTAQTRYGEALWISQDETMTFQAMYQVLGTMEDPLLAEVDLGVFHTYIRAHQALADYVIDHWGSYRAWEEQAETEMMQEQTDD